MDSITFNITRCKELWKLHRFKKIRLSLRNDQALHYAVKSQQLNILIFLKIKEIVNQSIRGTSIIQHH